MKLEQSVEILPTDEEKATAKSYDEYDERLAAWELKIIPLLLEQLCTSVTDKE